MNIKLIEFGPSFQGGREPMGMTPIANDNATKIVPAGDAQKGRQPMDMTPVADKPATVNQAPNTTSGGKGQEQIKK
jgi:hypothetical protein